MKEEWTPGIYSLRFGTIRVDPELTVTWLSGEYQGKVRTHKQWRGYRPEWIKVRNLTPEDPYAETDF